MPFAPPPRGRAAAPLAPFSRPAAAATLICRLPLPMDSASAAPRGPGPARAGAGLGRRARPFFSFPPTRPRSLLPPSLPFHSLSPIPSCPHHLSLSTLCPPLSATPHSAEVISYSEWRDLYYVQTAKGAYIKNTVENYPESVTVSEVSNEKRREKRGGREMGGGAREPAGGVAPRARPSPSLSLSPLAPHTLTPLTLPRPSATA